jgi:hypothetical protein
MPSEAGCGRQERRDVESRCDGREQGRDQQAESAPIIGAGAGARRGEPPKALKRATVSRTAIRWHTTQAPGTLGAVCGQSPGGLSSPMMLFNRLKAIDGRADQTDQAASRRSDIRQATRCVGRRPDVHQQPRDDGREPTRAVAQAAEHSHVRQARQTDAFRGPCDTRGFAVTPPSAGAPALLGNRPARGAKNRRHS